MDNERKDKIKLHGIRRISSPENRAENDTVTDNPQAGLQSQQSNEIGSRNPNMDLQDQSERSETMVHTVRTAQLDHSDASSIQSETKMNINDGEDRTVVHTAKSPQNILPTTLSSMSEANVNRKKQMTPWERDRINGARVYKIVGYTTVDKINRKFYAERQQRFVRKLLTTVLVIALIVLLVLKINPIKNLSDFRRILGLDSLYNENQQQEDMDLPENPLSTTTESNNP